MGILQQVLVLRIFCIAAAIVSLGDEGRKWKNTLLPSTCDNDVLDCSERGQSSFSAHELCNGTFTAVTFYDNFLLGFPDGMQSAVIVNVSRNELEQFWQSQVNSEVKVLDLSRNRINSSNLQNLSSLEKLYININRFTNLNFLPETCVLYELDASHNSIANLEGQLHHCTRLRTLNLSFNQLQVLPQDIFSQMLELRELRLGINHLTIPSPQTFAALTNLEFLDLFSSRITTIPDGLFGSLSQLKILLLGGDSITVSPNTFSPLTSLETLGMSQAELRAFPEELLSKVPSLENLYLSWNSISVLPREAFRQLPRLRLLHLDSIGVRSLPADVFSNLTNLKTLSLHENNLRTLPRGLLSGLENLEKVDLGFNPLREIPTQELSRVKIAILGSPRRRSVESREFSAMQNLNVLSLSNGNIPTIEEDAFEGLSSLQWLNLASNRLNELSPRVFQGLRDLKTIDLFQNRLTALPESVFFGLSNLTELSLRANRLSVLPEGVFRGLVSLEELYLDMNNLTDVAPDLFANLPSLRLLNLQHNPLTALPAPPPGTATGPLLVRLDIERPAETALRAWLNESRDRYVDLSGRPVAPSALRWLLSEPQVRMRADVERRCTCGAARRGRVLVRVCVPMDAATTTPCHARPPHWTWVDAIRDAQP